MKDYKCTLCSEAFPAKKGHLTYFNFKDYMEFEGGEELLIPGQEDICWDCKKKIVESIREFLNKGLPKKVPEDIEGLNARLSIVENQLGTLWLLVKVEETDAEGQEIQYEK